MAKPKAAPKPDPQPTLEPEPTQDATPRQPDPAQVAKRRRMSAREYATEARLPPMTADVLTVMYAREKLTRDGWAATVQALLKRPVTQ